MAKKQTRRSISFNRALFDLVVDAAARENKSASQFVVELVRAKLDPTKLPQQNFDGPLPRRRSPTEFTINGHKFRPGMA